MIVNIQQPVFRQRIASAIVDVISGEGKGTARIQAQDGFCLDVTHSRSQGIKFLDHSGADVTGKILKSLKKYA